MIENWLAQLDSEVRATRQPVPYERAMASFERIAKTTVRGAVDANASNVDPSALEDVVLRRAASRGESRDG